jgi:DNA-binding NtrC family response regulator
MLQSKSVILVGENLESNLPSLLSTLRAHRFELVETRDADDLRELLSQKPSAAVIVYDAGDGSTAHAVLRITAEMGKKIPVVVIVDRGRFEEYYELMCEGAYDYFEKANCTGEIERSVQWAARAQAA